MDTSTHCKHGTFVGHPGGPDYLCGWCEDGTTDAEFLAWQAGAAQRRIDRSLAKLAEFDKVSQVLRDAGIDWSRAVQALEDFANGWYFADTRQIILEVV